MTLSNVESDLLVVLEAIKEGQVSHLGICGNLDRHYYRLREEGKLSKYASNCDAHDALQNLFYGWPKFSGRKMYPVPDPAKKRADAEEAYDQAYDRETMWSKNSAYGRLRWELLNYCIDTLKGKQVSE